MLNRLNYNALLKEWTRNNSSVKEVDSRSKLFKNVYSRFDAELPLSYLEFGVYKGESILEWSTLNQNPQSSFVGFDSFVGLPHKWFSQYDKGAFSTNGIAPSVDDGRVKFVKGLFHETLPSFLSDFSPSTQFVVFIDCDLYESAIYVLTMLNSFMKKGTVIIFDDFADPTGEFRAFRDYIGSYKRRLSPICQLTRKGFARHVAFVVG